MGGYLTLQIQTKTNCCVQIKDTDNYNEDISDDEKNNDTNDDKIINKIDSFMTDPNLID